MEDKLNVSVDLTAQLVHQIVEVATWQAKCIAADSPKHDFRLTADHIRDAANLVFLAMDLIRERAP